MWGWLQIDRVREAGLQGGGSEDKPSAQLSVVVDCSRSGDCARHPMQATCSKSDINIGVCMHTRISKIKKNINCKKIKY